MEDYIIYKLYTRINKKDKTIFIVTFLFTFLVHAFILLNSLPNADGINFFWHDQDSIVWGRWFLKYAAGIGSYFYLQYLNGLLSVIYIACTAVFVVKLLEINDFFLCVLAGAVIGAYPTIACTFTYMWAADAYMLSMLLSAISVYLMISGNWKRGIAGGILLGFSMGIYQAYLSFALVLLCCWMFKQAWVKARMTWKVILGIICDLVIGGVVYLIGLFSRLNGRTLTSYQGIGQSTLLHAPMWYLEKIMDCYKKLPGIILQDDVFNNGFIQVIVFVLCVIILCNIVARSIRLIIEREWVVLLSTWGSILLIPIAIFYASLLSEGATYHKLMVQSVALIWMIPILLIDNRRIEQHRIAKSLAGLMIICLLLNVGNYIVGDNIIYFSLSVGYGKTYALSVRIVDRMEALDNYGDAEYVYIGGSMIYQDDDLARKLTPMTGQRYGDILTYYNLGYVRMINRYVGGSYEALTSAEKVNDLTSSLEYQEMPIWPAQDSVRMIDNVIVVKLSEDE